MPAKNQDLHGNVTDQCPVALLLIDVINDFDYEGGEELLRQALPMAKRLAELKRKARAHGVPVLYVNDNFGKWRSDLRALVAHALEPGARGRPVAELLRPDEEDYFVLKPKHSGFFSTTLETLLAYLRAKMLVLTGLTGDNCVLFTASDAFLRDYYIVVPRDGVVSIDPENNERALQQMSSLLDVDTRASGEIDFEVLKRAAQERERRRPAFAP